MSCAMTRDEAARLYEVLDRTMGVFRGDNMSDKELAFYTEKRQEFIEQFSTSIPESYWFQGTICASATLVFDSIENFHVVCISPDKQAQRLVEEVVNPELKDTEFVYWSLEDAA